MVDCDSLACSYDLFDEIKQKIKFMTGEMVVPFYIYTQSVPTQVLVDQIHKIVEYCVYEREVRSKFT